IHRLAMGETSRAHENKEGGLSGIAPREATPRQKPPSSYVKVSCLLAAVFAQQREGEVDRRKRVATRKRPELLQALGIGNGAAAAIVVAGAFAVRDAAVRQPRPVAAGADAIHVGLDRQPVGGVAAAGRETHLAALRQFDLEGAR